MNPWIKPGIKKILSPPKTLISQSKNPLNWIWLIPMIIIGILGAFIATPIIYLQLIRVLYFFNFQELMLFILIVIIQGCIGNIASYMNSMQNLKGFMRYLQYLIGKKVSMKIHNLNEYLSTDIIESKLVKRIDLSRYKMNQPLGYAISVKPPLGIEIGCLKGFTIANTIINTKRSINYHSFSFIILRDSPEEISDISKFFLLHEIGHMTREACEFKERKLLQILTIITLTSLFLFQYSVTNPISLMGLILFITAYFYDIRTNDLKRKEEYFCDTLAIDFLYNDFNFNKLQKLLNLLHRSDPKRLSFINEAFKEKRNDDEVFSGISNPLWIGSKMSIGIIISTLILFTSIFYSHTIISITPSLLILMIAFIIYIVCHYLLNKISTTVFTFINK